MSSQGKLNTETPNVPSDPESTNEHDETGEKDGGEVSDVRNPSNADIMEVFKGMEKRVSVKINELLSAITEVTKRMTEAEERISGAEDEIVQLKTRADLLETQVKSMLDKVDDLECRNWRNNLRLVSLPEKKEGMDICAFLEKWLPEILELDSSHISFIIEKVHRIPSSSQGRRRQDGNGPPRTIIMKFLNFKQTEQVLKAARAKGIIKYKDHNLRFFPDLSAEVHRKQRSYDAARQKLCEKGINRHRIVFPARLLLMHGDCTMTLNSPEEVENYMQRIDGKSFVEAYKLNLSRINQALDGMFILFTFIIIFIINPYWKFI